MGSYCDVKIEDTSIDWYKNYLSDEIISLFNDCDLVIRCNDKMLDTSKINDFEDYLSSINYREGITFVYESDTDTIKKRLMIYGYNDHELNELISESKSQGALDDTLVGGYSLYSHIKKIKTRKKIFLDVTDLVYGGWLEREEILTKKSGLGNPLIVAEGVTDTFILKESLKHIYPNLVDNIDFLDLSFKPEGSASSAIKMAKSFASASIPKRILFLLDNDTAARDAMRSVKKFKFPKNIKILHYPDIEICNNYPTIGAQGIKTMNINKLAASIELYLGNDSITNSDGKLEPVQWKGFIEGIGEYQGVITNKERVKDRFRKILKKSDKKQIEKNMKNLKIIWDYVLTELETLQQCR